MTRRIIIIAFCLLFGVLVVVTLSISSNNTITKNNPFIRLIPPHAVEIDTIFGIKYNSYYISGNTNYNMYLGNSTSPTHILSVNTSSFDTSVYSLQTPGSDFTLSDEVHLSVDSPNFIIMDLVTTNVFNGNLNSLLINKIKPNNRLPIFSLGIPISENSLIIRTYDTTRKSNILTKANFENGNLKTANPILKKQVDGFFCTDGSIFYDKESNQITYLYYYRNQYIVADTNLQTIRTGKTIDTTTIAKIKVSSYEEGGGKTRTISSPPNVVNKRHSVSNNRIYIQSGMLASNESRETFNQNSVIDVYELISGEYRYSFYLPNANNGKLRDFRVVDNRLFALQGNDMIIFKLNLR